MTKVTTHRRVTALYPIGASMSKGEQALLNWLRQHDHADPDRVPIGIGDDMAAVVPGADTILISADMLLDGVHFDSAQHTLAQIAHKAIACSISDCAAMAVVPVAAVTSLALPNRWSGEQAQQLLEALNADARRYDCPIVGGDITSWAGDLAIDVTVIAKPDGDRPPIRRTGAIPHDAIYVTGTLGGSLAGKHISFEPRLAEARTLAHELGDQLHAMMDISDGISLDLWRICQASDCGALLDEQALLSIASHDAKISTRPTLNHVLHDGEDFELLLIVLDSATPTPPPCGLTRVGRTVKTGLAITQPDGEPQPIVPRGYEHFQ